MTLTTNFEGGRPTLALGACAPLLLLALLAGCKDKAPPPPPAAGGPPVTAALAIEKPIVELQEFSGRLEAIERVEIRPRVAGFITAVNVKPGAEVDKGEVLFVIDARPYKAEADRADAGARSARARSDRARV